jgi:transposase-like protein
MREALMRQEREIYLGPHPTKANGFSPRGLLTLAILVLYAFRVSTRKVSAFWKDLRLWVTPKISPVIEVTQEQGKTSWEKTLSEEYYAVFLSNGFGK